MATLNSWQKISRVLSSDFGDGASGSATVSSDPNTRATFTGTATQTTGTAGSTAFSNGDLVMLHQTRGTGAGQWEINSIASGGGSTSLTFSTALNYSYVSGAQIIKIPRYTTATVSGFTVTAWNGSTGGVSIIAAKTSISITGTQNAKGSDRNFSGPGAQISPVNGGGFRGGWSDDGVNSTGLQGESPTGAGSQSSSANGGGGGAGGGNANFNAGGGGGYASSGTAATGSGATNGSGGGTYGSSDLTAIHLGSGGGGATGVANSNQASGANGGGCIILISKEISITGSITTNGGGNSLSNYRICGGGGSGGSVLLVGDTITIGTSLITAIGGVTTDSEAEKSGDGGNGRVAIHYKTSVTGTSNPTYTGVQDTTLKEGGVTNFFMFF